MNLDELQDRVRESIYGPLMEWERKEGIRDMPIADKYQNLSAEELSDLVLEGEEVFQQIKENTPLIHVNENAHQKPYYEALIRHVVPTIKANEVWVSRSSSSAYNVSDSRGLHFRVYDADLRLLKRVNSGIYPSQLLVPIRQDHDL